MSGRARDRMPGWLIGLTVVVACTLVASIAALNAANGIRAEVLKNRANGNRTRALACLTLVVDNDRTWPLPVDCSDPNVTQHYPPEACVKVEGLCGPAR